MSETFIKSILDSSENSLFVSTHVSIGLFIGICKGAYIELLSICFSL